MRWAEIDCMLHIENNNPDRDRHIAFMLLHTGRNRTWMWKQESLILSLEQCGRSLFIYSLQLISIFEAKQRYNI